MENLNTYIKEALVNHKIKKQEYKYHPKTTYELIEYIKTELKEDNTNLNCIDTSNITDMKNLFDQDIGVALATEQQKTLDVSEWDVSQVKNMDYMFYGCKEFNSDLSSWDVSKVENMNEMFFNCKRFNSNLSGWNVSNVKNMSSMFFNCKNFNSDLSNWDVSNIENIYDMFDLSGLEGNEPSWYKK